MINRLQLRLMKSNSVTRQTLNDRRAVTCSDRRSINTLTEEVRGGNQSRLWLRSDTIRYEGRRMKPAVMQDLFLWVLISANTTCTSCTARCKTTQDSSSQHVCSAFSSSSGASRLVWKYRILNILKDRVSFSVSKYTQACVCVCQQSL